jgi:hypothetical protein
MVGLDLRVHTNTLAGYCIPTYTVAVVIIIILYLYYINYVDCRLLDSFTS